MRSMLFFTHARGRTQFVFVSFVFLLALLLHACFSSPRFAFLFCSKKAQKSLNPLHELI
jgi:hypothetical protein